MATVVVLSTPIQVHAEPHSSTSTARELSEQARRAYNLGNWQEAIDAFARAYQITGDPALLFNLGQAHRQAGHTADAIRFYRIYLREDPAGSNGEIARQQLAQLENQPQPGPPEPAAKAPIPAGASVSPKGIATPPASTMELPRNGADPGESIPARPSNETEPSSPRSFTLGSPPVANAEAVVHVSTATSSEKSRRALPTWVPWTAGAVTIALLATAVIVHVEANNRFNDLQMSCAKVPPGCSPSQVDGVKSRDHATTGLVIAGGVAAIGTGLAFFANGTF